MAIPVNPTRRLVQAQDYTSDIVQYVDPNGELLSSINHAGALLNSSGVGFQSLSAINTFGGYSQLVAAPSTATSPGAAGQIAYDATHIYVCVATNVWVRAVLATF